MDKKALGRGLHALIPEKTELKERVVYIQMESIAPNPYQPREGYDPSRLKELTESIKTKGIIQPILVRSRQEGGYELIAGERRLRAAKELNIEEIPAIVKDVSDEEAFELALIENLQREELNPLEEAHAYQRLINEFGFTQEKIAQTIGKDRTSIANSLRLLKLPLEIQQGLIRGQISAGHARALLTVENPNQQIQLFHLVVNKGISVRELESLAREKGAFKMRRKRQALRPKDPHITAIEEDLQHIVGTKVRISTGRKRGFILIEFYSSNDLERILKILRK
jgi:ParB family chromosome partitioning protein